MVKTISSLFLSQTDLPKEGKYNSKKAWLHYVAEDFLLISKYKRSGKKLFKVGVEEWKPLKKSA